MFRMSARIQGRWIWRRESPRVLHCANALSAEEQANVRRALRHLQQVFGSLAALAKVMGVPYQSVRHAMVERRHPSAGLAFRAARVVGVPMEDLVSGVWPPDPKACPTCGRRIELGRMARAKLD